MPEATGPNRGHRQWLNPFFAGPRKGLQSGSRGHSRIYLPEPDAPGEGTTFGQIPLRAVGAPARPIAARGTGITPQMLRSSPR